jgi:hypothetical protein
MNRHTRHASNLVFVWFVIILLVFVGFSQMKRQEKVIDSVQTKSAAEKSEKSYEEVSFQ